MLALLGIALLSGLAAWAALLVIPACGLDLGTFGRLDHCPPAFVRSTELDAETKRQALLKDRLNGLQRQLAMLPDCPPPIPTGSMQMNGRKATSRSSRDAGPWRPT